MPPDFKIRVAEPNIEEDDAKAVYNAVKEKCLSGSGPYNKQFEKKFAEYIGTKYAIAVNSGTAALHLSLEVLGINGGDEVITTPFTFAATSNVIIMQNAKPIFVDIEPETMCIDPNEIQKSITPKTTTILPVHFGGFPCNLKNIQNIADRHNLTIIEDAAHATGATYNNKKIGSYGTATCFSFHPVKNLAMPTGGLISINHKNHKQFRKTLLARRWCGITDRIDSEYDIKELGWNYYMNEFSAVIGLAQLKKLDKLNNVRKNIAKFYDKQINVEHKIPFDKRCSYHLYWICVKNRNQFRRNLFNRGIETGTHYKPIHKMSFYKSSNKILNTEKVGKEIVTIPIHPNLTQSQLDYITESINNFV